MFALARLPAGAAEGAFASIYDGTNVVRRVAVENVETSGPRRTLADYENNASNNTFFYANCGEEEELADLSIDVALHPNDAGYQRMADELLRAFRKALDLTGCLMP